MVSKSERWLMCRVSNKGPAKAYSDQGIVFAGNHEILSKRGESVSTTIHLSQHL